MTPTVRNDAAVKVLTGDVVSFTVLQVVRAVHIWRVSPMQMQGCVMQDREPFPVTSHVACSFASKQLHAGRALQQPVDRHEQTQP